MASTSQNYPKKYPERNTFRDELGKYLKYWPWFLLCLALAVTGGYFYLRYTTPVYKATASIIINEETNNTGGRDLAFNDAGLMGGLGTNSIEKELAILKSRRLMRDVVSALKLNVRYFQEGQIREVELYKDLPFSFKILRMDEEKLRAHGGGNFKISRVGRDMVKVTFTDLEKSLVAPAGSVMDLGFADVVITPSHENRPFSETIVRIARQEEMAAMLRGRVQLLQTGKTSNVIELVLEDPVRERARDVLDQLIFEFNRDAIEDKNLIAGNTAKFINERLDIINDELESVETGKEAFKESHRLTDIQAESNLNMQSAREYNDQRQEIGTQVELANAMLDYLGTSSNEDLLPANLGIQENAINQQIGEYNNLVLERNRILGSSTEKNPVVIRISNKLEQIRSNIEQSLQRLLNNLHISLDEVNRQYSSIGARILAVPSQERQYRGIERQQGIKEALYLFLLQKREDNSLALAVTAPKAKIVDRAYNSGGMVSPNSRSIYLGTVILGLFVPFSLIYFKGLIDNKIKTKADIEDAGEEIFFVGELPKVRKQKEITIGSNDRSELSEAFRILIINLEYLLVNCPRGDGAISILVTSTIKGEGKTFTSLNLGVTLANNNKKVLIVGADLRNPRLIPYLSKNDHLGVSDYLANHDVCLSELICKSTIHPGLDVLPSGSIPPNPSELLRTEKTQKMFEELKPYYDYIIIDTAPSMLVADTFTISRFSDLILYVVRAGYTDKKLMEFVMDSRKTGAFRNIGFVLNNVASSNLAYGSKYGYGYGTEKNGFWKKISV